MKKIFLLFGYCFILLLPVFCSIVNKIAIPKQSDKDLKKITAITQFSLNILLKSPLDKENIVYSPVLLHNIFTLLSNGAKDNTLKELESIIGFSSVEMNEYYKTNFQKYEGSDLNISNMVWVDNDLVLDDAFLNTCTKFPLTQVKDIDFSNQTAKTMINSWIDSNTNHTIKNMIESINPEEKILITSALHFTSNWDIPFLEKDNVIDRFYSSNGSNQNVKYMHSKRGCQFINDDYSTGVILRYSRSDFSFFFLTPNENISMKNFIETISGTELLRKIQNGKNNYQNISLFIPKFKVEYLSNLTDILKKMGYSNIFDLTNADFSRITKDKESVFIENIVQKTLLTIDEKGTEASSATAIYLDGSMTKRKKEPFELKFNKPFVFGIIDNHTNIPLIIGVVNNL